MTPPARDPAAAPLGAPAPRRTGRTMGVAAMSRAAPVQAELAAPGDDERIAATARENIDFVWRVLRRQGLSPADADDGTQRVFLVLRDKIRLVAPGAEKGFLFHTATFVARELRRGARRFEPPTEANLTPERSPCHRIEAADFLDKAMSDLDDDERAAFVLFEVEGLTMDEIARMLACPQGTVASRLRRARAKVRAAAARIDAVPGGGV